MATLGRLTLLRMHRVGHGLCAVARRHRSGAVDEVWSENSLGGSAVEALLACHHAGRKPVLTLDRDDGDAQLLEFFSLLRELTELFLAQRSPIGKNPDQQHLALSTQVGESPAPSGGCVQFEIGRYFPHFGLGKVRFVGCLESGRQLRLDRVTLAQRMHRQPDLVPDVAVGIIQGALQCR